MRKDDATWLDFCYIFFGFLVAYVVYKAVFAITLQMGWADRFSYEWAVGAVCGLGALFAIRASKYREFHLHAIGELKKVKWPTLEDTKKMTIIVAVVVAILSVILSAFDILWSKILQLILP